MPSLHLDVRALNLTADQRVGYAHGWGERRRYDCDTDFDKTRLEWDKRDLEGISPVYPCSPLLLNVHNLFPMIFGNMDIFKLDTRGRHVYNVDDYGKAIVDRDGNTDPGHTVSYTCT